MAQFHAQNERVKRQYLEWLKEADGKDEKTLDQVASSLHDFEYAIGFKSFKSFHRDWAKKFKMHLDKARHHRTGKPLSLSTRDARLRQVKAFFKWLAAQSGYRSRIAFSDVEYFNNNTKDARAAHARRPIPYPSIEQCNHAFGLMPDETDIEKRNKAVFAFLMLTGARASALASMRIGNIDLLDGVVLQDGRYVNTKYGKTIETWFLPVDTMYRDFLETWVQYLRNDLLFGPTDAVFPKPEREANDGKFRFERLSREPYANSQKIHQVIKASFEAAGLHRFTPHAFRKTLALHSSALCDRPEEFKALSQNIGHDSTATTMFSYMPVSRERQRELIQRLGRG